jgi:PAS domain S-box-containing protein
MEKRMRPDQKGRKKVEAIDTTEFRYQDLLQSVTDYVIAINRKHQIIMANDRFKNEFGMYSRGLCHEVWKKRRERCANCPVEKSFEDGEVHWDEETVVMKEGRIAEMLVKSTPIKNERGDVVYVLETATDITEKRRLEKELEKMEGHLEEVLAERFSDLRKSEERYRTIFEYSRDAILLTDPKGHIIEINRAGIEILGYQTKEELMTKNSVAELFKERKDFVHFLKSISRDGFVREFSARLVGKGARSFDALTTSSVILNVRGEIAGYVIIVRDITKAKKAQEQIQKQNVRLATLNAVSMTVSSSLDLKEVLLGTIDKIHEILDSDSVRIYLLDQEKSVLVLAAHDGLSPEFVEKEHIKFRKIGDGLLGQMVEIGETRIVDNLLRSEDPYVDFLIAEGFKSTIYIPLVSKGHAVGVMAVSSHSAFKFSNEYVAFLTAIGNQIGVAIDNANLYESLKQAYEELKQAQEQVIQAEKLASLGKLAATIAHEINNPIAAVLTYIKLMMKLVKRERFTTERLADISRYLNTMEAETARCGEIVKNLLAFSRQSNVTIGTNSLEEIISRTLALLSHDLEMKGIKLVKEIPPDLPKIACDFKQIQQAFLNLFVNAAEAMSQGGTLTVTAKILQDSRYVDVSISDTGYGIGKEDIKRIFEPFFTTKEEGKGVGLGLSVVFGIIARHKGTIDVKSQVGEGTVFTVRLPVAKGMGQPA